MKAAAFHVGVVLALQAKGFRFRGGLKKDSSDSPPTNGGGNRDIQVYVGSSAGSLVTTYMAQGKHLDDLVNSFRSKPDTDAIPGLKYWELMSPRIRSAGDWLSLDNFLIRMFFKRTFQSPFSTEGILKYLRNHIIVSDNFSELGVDLYVVTTELNRPRKVIFGPKVLTPSQLYLEYRNDVCISDACAASMSLPPLYHPYTIQIDGEARDFFDGEIREPLSSHVALESGCDLIICSYTHQPVHILQSKKSLRDRGVQDIVLQGIYQSIEQKIRSSRQHRDREKGLVDATSKFFKENELGDALRDKFIGILEDRMTYKSHVDYIYIHPKAADFETFAESHFSLKRHKTERIVKRGYIAGISALKSLL